MNSLPIIPIADARRLFLHGQGLLDNPSRRAGPHAVAKLVQQLGFVQVDSIQRIERAHHLILGVRLDAYRATQLEQVAFGERKLFEHWTHDAALIPIQWFEFWKPRFLNTEERLRKSRWFTHRLGNEPERVLQLVYQRINRDGPLRASDFERSVTRPATGWWDWTPEKAALEFLWHTGRLSVAGREHFQKIYDLTERVFPDVHLRQAPNAQEYIDWACGSALERLGTATPGELAAFWHAVTPAIAGQWCRKELAAQRIQLVNVVSQDGVQVRKAFIFADWEKRLHKVNQAPDRFRLLAPFDPIIRDRKRLQRLFAFDYRFEAFVPAKQRRYGYYVLPILEGEELIGRLDPHHDRKAQALIINNVWWEPNVRFTRERQRKLKDALAVLAKQIGAKEIILNRRKK